MVDTLATDKDILQKVKAEELPEALQQLKPAEREAKVQEMASRRAELQKQIGKLAAEREAYLSQEQKRLAEETGAETLGDAVVAAVQKQLTDSGFELAK